MSRKPGPLQTLNDGASDEANKIDAIVVLGSLCKQMSEEERWALCDDLMLLASECDEGQWNLQRLSCEVLGDIGAVLDGEKAERLSERLVSQILEARTLRDRNGKLVWWLNSIHRLLKGKKKVASEVLIAALIDLTTFVSNALTVMDSLFESDDFMALRTFPEFYLRDEGANFNRITFDALYEVAAQIPQHLISELAKAVSGRIKRGFASQGGPCEGLSALRLLVRLDFTHSLSTRMQFMRALEGAYLDEEYSIRQMGDEETKRSIAAGWRFFELFEHGNTTKLRMWQVLELERMIDHSESDLALKATRRPTLS